MKKIKILFSLVLVFALILTSVPFAFANSQVLSYSEDFEGYSDGYALYDYTNASNDQDFITYGGNGRKRLNKDYANLYVNTDPAYVHSGSQSMYGTTFCQYATTIVDLSPNTEYKLSFWYMYKQNSSAPTYVYNMKYGLMTANTETCEGLTEVNGAFKTENLDSSFVAGVWREATLTFTTGDYVSDILFGYRYADTNGLEGEEQVLNKATLYVDDIAIVPTAEEEPETPEEPEAPYEKSYDFEGYEAGTLLYDNDANSTEQEFVVYSNKKTLLTSFGALTVKADSGYAKSGSKALSGGTYWQYATTKVDLKPNTQYYAEFWYTYKRNSKYPTTYMEQITYGFYKTSDDALTLGDKLPQKGSTVTDTIGAEFEPTEWRKASMLFTTGADVENVVFGYTYRDIDESGTINKAILYVDDFVIMDAKPVNITLNAKNNVAVVPVSGNLDSTVMGSTLQFKVIAEPGLTPTVKVEDQTLTAVDGVYTVAISGDTVIDIITDADDDNLPMHGKDYDGNDLTKYNREVYMKPIGENNTVYHEAALFYTGRDTIKLLYPVSEIISLRSYDLSTTYIKGVDFDITADGQIKRLEGSRIPVYTEALVGGINSNESNKSFTTADGQYLQFIGDTIFPRFAVAVTYKYDEKWEDGFQGYKVPSAVNDIPNTIAKLENGEEVNIVVYGDSTSTGMSASGHSKINVAPYAETWMDMFIGTLRAKYPNATINYENIAVGGKQSKWGAQNIATQLALLTKKPDLMVLAFGGNDLLGGVSPEDFGTRTNAIIDGLRNEENTNGNANAEVLLWSPKINNPVSTKYLVEYFLAYETALENIAQNTNGVGLAKVSSYIADVLNSKEAVDYLNTNVNHGNDFCSRMIAQGLITAMSPEAEAPETPDVPDIPDEPDIPEEIEDIAGDINFDEQVNLKDLVMLAKFVADWENLSYNRDTLDVNGDNLVNLEDVNYLARHLAGWEGYTPVINENLPDSEFKNDVDMDMDSE
jgi:lysophospholipase L1-like esterase